MKREVHKKKSATVIIGANFGDEGKGLMTDWAANAFGKDALIVRFNGGAQAGHTVVLPNGTRHIHSHFGSGTLAGAQTFLSRFFVSNPLLFNREIVELERKAVKNPTVYADELGFVTTPFDMLLNQFAEQSRGAGKHGSCGVGFGETIERCLNPKFSTAISDLNSPQKLSEKLEKIRREWLPVRLKKLGIENLSAKQKEIFFADDLIKNFLESAAHFFGRIRIASPDILRQTENIIFEGAQGLLLDQDFGWFPHVTRSNTGLKNVVELVKESNINDLEVIYATRCYLTRHGAGPLANELNAPPFKGIRDETNIHNLYQGSLRFAPLDLDLLAGAIDFDFCKNEFDSKMNLTRSLAITCLDQTENEPIKFFNQGEKCESAVNEFIRQSTIAAQAQKTYLSYGQTREFIVANE